MNMIKKLKAELKDFGIIDQAETIINIKYVKTFKRNKKTYKTYEIEYKDADNSIWHKDITIAIADSLGTLQQIVYTNRYYHCYICYVISKDMLYRID